MRGSFEARRENGDGAVNNVALVVAPIEHKFADLSEGANTINEEDRKFAGTSEAKFGYMRKMRIMQEARL